ncbi:amidase [Alcanivorax sp. 521-1]|uniref:Amidase n=1 Tax=Alloalcanivorax profundimaris TaxID=2735259 RepID=A0ABS0AMV9_9GAMM|nr:amidase family protein [Alloalcanivorax profundimaris]MBF5054952.1 amidase [Alloalcanivorax profundimaris]
MKLTEYVALDALGMARLVKQGEITPRDLVECALIQAEAQRESINAVASVDQARALERAERAAGGAFQGVPFLVKELLNYPGLRTGMGSRLFQQHIPAEGSAYTRRLDDAGLVVAGNSTSSEFGLLGSTESLAHGPTRNPWNPAYAAGGSSGGSAAAVAAGVVPLAHASDGGGSIRAPASLCGLFGFMPSAGRCVSAGNQGTLTELLGEHCISRSVRDSAALLAATEAAGAQARYRPIGFRHEAGTRRLRIGYYTRTLMGTGPEPDIEASLDDVVELCRGLGHTLEPTPGPPVDGKAISDAFFTLAGGTLVEMAEAMAPILGRSPGPEDLEPFTLDLIKWYRQRDTGAIKRATAALQTAALRMRRFAERFDVLLCPTLAGSPRPLGFLSPRLSREELVARTETYVGYTPIHNLAGMPAMSVPLSSSPEGLPIGSHFAARPGNDAVLLGLAYELEAAAPWVQRLPLDILT